MPTGNRFHVPVRSVPEFTHATLTLHANGYAWGDNRNITRECDFLLEHVPFYFVVRTESQTVGWNHLSSRMYPETTLVDLFGPTAQASEHEPTVPTHNKYQVNIMSRADLEDARCTLTPLGYRWRARRDYWENAANLIPMGLVVSLPEKILTWTSVSSDLHPLATLREIVAYTQNTTSSDGEVVVCGHRVTYLDNGTVAIGLMRIPFDLLNTIHMQAMAKRF